MLTKNRIRTNIFAVLASVFALTIVFGTVVSAVDNSPNVIKVTPVRSDIQIAAGASAVVPLTVTNLTSSDINVSAIENDFVAGDEKGTPALILDANEFAPTHSLKRFMTPIADTVVPANKSVTIRVTITVPQDAQSGGYFGAVRFAPSTPGSGGQVNLSASAASLILLTVPGPTVEKLTLTNFDIQQNGKSSANFSTPDNLIFSIRFANDGNIQEGPFGKVSVKSGSKVVYSADFNTDTPRDMVLPDSARRWDIPLKNIGSFGHYTVSATFTYGADNVSIDVSKSFWVIPFWAYFAAGGLVLLLIAIIILVLFLMRRRGRRRRMYGRGRGRSSGSAGNLRF